MYVPVSSSEEGAGSLPDYECCRFRGSVVALDAASGKQIWKSYTIPEEPVPVRKNARGTQLWGPSGAAIWSSPVIDEARGALYVTTGNNYSDPTTRTSDAFLAMDLATGRIRWTHQVTPRDGYVSACRLTDKTNCPEANGPDFDFAASPILVPLGNGRRALVAGHKSGNVYAVDPDREGARLWESRIGQGGSMGGVQWGSAADGEHVYVALSDLGRVMLTYTQFTDADRQRGGGMFALRLRDGAQVWHTPPVPCDSRPRCSPAQSGCGQCHSRRRLCRVARRAHSRLRRGHRPHRLGLRHRPVLRHRERRPGARRFARWPGAGDRRRPAVRELGLHRGRRHRGQRRAGVLSGRSLTLLDAAAAATLLVVVLAIYFADDDGTQVARANGGRRIARRLHR